MKLIRFTMFGGNRLIWISGTTRRNLIAAIKPVLETPPDQCRIIVEAGDLKRDSALRKAVEKSKIAAAIACYSDGPREIARLIDSELQAAGMVMEKDARQLLASHLGGDRQASRNELQKLILYCHGQDRISADDITAIIGDVSTVETAAVIDAVITGDVEAMHAGLAHLLVTGMSPDMIMLFSLRHFQLIQQVRHQIESQGLPGAAAISAIRPPLHFSRKAKTEKSTVNLGRRLH